MNIYDVLLILLHVNGGQLTGKTNVHKNVFLAKKMLSTEGLELPISFKPYFYGPFSSGISNALDVLESANLIASSDTDVWSGSELELRRVEYRLTPQGQKAVQKALLSNSPELRAISRCFDKISQTGFNQKTRIMATAAKIDHVLSQEQQPLTLENIEAKARDLGWRLNKTDLSRAVSLLSSLGLARVDDA